VAVPAAGAISMRAKRNKKVKIEAIGLEQKVQKRRVYRVTFISTNAFPMKRPANWK
jgi:hypothetical protein